MAILRGMHRAGAWVFDHSGPFAPALARIGYSVPDRLFPQSFFANDLNPVPLEGLRFHHEGRPSYHVQMLAMGMHDREVVRLLKELVVPGTCVVDVGAHIGYFSLLCARLAGSSGTVWAFEPSPSIVELLRKNILENGFDNQIHVDPRVVSNALGTTMFYVHPAESMLSGLREPPNIRRDAPTQRGDDAGRAGSGSSECIEVGCTTLDAWAEQQNWPSVDLVKMDIEGSEISALEGMVELRRRNPRLKLIIELNPTALSGAGATIGDFWQALRRCDFTKISMAGRSLRRVEFPADVPQILHTIRRLGNDRVNLLCETDAVPRSDAAQH